MLVLYDLQDELKNYTAGDLPKNPRIEANPNQHATLSVIEEEGAKTILVSNRHEVSDGITINMNEIEGLRPGDRLTISGRTGSGAPTVKWGMLIHRGGGSYSLLEQHNMPAPDELYFLTYLLDAVDLEHPIRLRTDHWGNEEAHMDFFVDDILITRNLKNAGTVTDGRDVVYSLATDEYAREGLVPAPGTRSVPTFLQTSGEPEFILLEEGGKKSIIVRRRVHDWDGVDIHLTMMGLKQGCSYTINVEGRIEGEAHGGAQMMMQVLPGYVWRDNKDVNGGEEFSLSHTLSNAEILNAEVIRITSNPQGAKMTFVITDIILKVNNEGAA
jgi:hypothetical protein